MFLFNFPFEISGSVCEAVVKSARFVQYFMVSSVLKLFKTTGIGTTSRTTAPAQT